MPSSRFFAIRTDNKSLEVRSAKKAPVALVSQLVKTTTKDIMDFRIKRIVDAEGAFVRNMYETFSRPITVNNVLKQRFYVGGRFLGLAKCNQFSYDLFKAHKLKHLKVGQMVEIPRQLKVDLLKGAKW